MNKKLLFIFLFISLKAFAAFEVNIFEIDQIRTEKAINYMLDVRHEVLDDYSTIDQFQVDVLEHGIQETLIVPLIKSFIENSQSSNYDKSMVDSILLRSMVPGISFYLRSRVTLDRFNEASYREIRSQLNDFKPTATIDEPQTISFVQFKKQSQNVVKIFTKNLEHFEIWDDGGDYTELPKIKEEDPHGATVDYEHDITIMSGFVKSAEDLQPQGCQRATCGGLGGNTANLNGAAKILIEETTEMVSDILTKDDKDKDKDKECKEDKCPDERVNPEDLDYEKHQRLTEEEERQKQEYILSTFTNTGNPEFHFESPSPLTEKEKEEKRKFEDSTFTNTGNSLNRIIRPRKSESEKEEERRFRLSTIINTGNLNLNK